MSGLSEVVDTLENRINKLLQQYDKMKQSYCTLEEEVETLKSQHGEFQEEIDQWREKCNSLQLANSMLGSDQYKRETKLKINALVREIDQCIAQLSE